MVTQQGKDAMGYDTSGKRIQQWLEEQKKLIKTKEVDWAKELELANKLEASSHKLLEESLSNPTPLSVDLYILVVQRYTTSLIAKLGLDIVKLSEQVAETQKMCKELKLATRGLPED